MSTLNIVQNISLSSSGGCFISFVNQCLIDASYSLNFEYTVEFLTMFPTFFQISSKGLPQKESIRSPINFFYQNNLPFFPPICWTYFYVCLLVVFPLADNVCLHITNRSDQSAWALCRYKSIDKTCTKHKAKIHYLAMLLQNIGEFF